MRLIDADELILHLNDYALQEAPFRGESADTYNAIENCIKAAEEQPTAYSVDKVVEELEKAKHEIASEDYCRSINDKEKCDGRDCFECCAEYLIEIVKQGGVSDDVCEWKLGSDGEYIQNPHTKRLYSNEPSMKNIFCNTCGKKIKVVDDDK